MLINLLFLLPAYSEVSPLHCAVQLERTELVELLVKNGANVSIQHRRKDGTGGSVQSVYYVSKLILLYQLSSG